MIPFLILHVMISTVLALLLSIVFGALSPWISAFSLLVGATAAYWQSRRVLKAFPDWRVASFTPAAEGVFEILLAGFVLYASLRHFIWLLFPLDHQLATLLAFNFGDLPLHINFIRAFADGVHFPPANPIFPADLLRYPYGLDLYNALWESLGVRLAAHLVLTGLAFTVASIVALRAYASWWGIGAFFLSGGLAGYEILSGAAISEFLKNIDWKNLFLSVFIPQRGFLIALPAGLMLLMGARRAVERKGPRAEALTSLGLIWGLLPFFHLHTFLVVSVMMFFAAIENGLEGLKRLFFSRLFFVAVAPATVFIWHSTDGFAKAGIAHWSWGWMAQAGRVPEFFLLNFGPWLLVPVLIAVGIAWPGGHFTEERKRRLWFELASYGLLLALFFNLMLAPWDWDNIKVLIWPYLGFARLAYLVLDARLGLIGRPVAAFFLLFSGFVNLLWLVQKPSERAVGLYPIGELAKTAEAVAAAPIDSVFAAGQTHNHTLTYFGRLRGLGYAGHLWSHSLDYGERQKKLEAIFRGEENWLELAKELGLSHIYWGPEERKQFGDGEKPWMKTLPNISPVEDHQVYSIVR